MAKKNHSKFKFWKWVSDSNSHKKREAKLNTPEMVFGFAVDMSNLKNKTNKSGKLYTYDQLVNYKIGLIKDKKTYFNNLEFGMKDFNCTHGIYQQLSLKVKNETPTNLDIRCVKIKATKLMTRIAPTFMFSKCQGDKCAPKKVINSFIKEFKVFAFSLSDESDHLKYNYKLTQKFKATPILTSEDY